MKIKERLKIITKLSLDNEIIAYWENYNKYIVSDIKHHFNNEKKYVCDLILKIVTALNKKEKYHSVAHIFKILYNNIYEILKDNKGEKILLLKFELAKGLFFSRHYKEANLLFKQLSIHPNYKSKIYYWYKQSKFAEVREQHWLQTFLLPILTNIGLTILYFFTAIKTNNFQVITLFYLLLLLVSDFYFENKKMIIYENVIKNKIKIKRLIIVELFFFTLLIVVLFFYQFRISKYLIFSVLFCFVVFQILKARIIYPNSKS